MAGGLRRPLFTARDAWAGGFYETWFLYAPGSDLDAALGAIWGFPRIVAGPVASRTSEPADQPTVEATSALDERLACSPCPTAPRRSARRIATGSTQDEVHFCLPLGSLVRRVAAGEVVSLWGRRRRLRRGSRHSRPFSSNSPSMFTTGAVPSRLTDFETMPWALHPDLERPGPIPPEHGAGIIDVQQGRLVWHPPTGRGGFEFPEA